MKELTLERRGAPVAKAPLAKEVASFHRYGGSEDGNLGEVVRMLGVRPAPRVIPEVRLGC
jgi:hypothetical protein